MKSKYKKLLNKCLTVSDRFAIQYAAYDEALAKLCSAHERVGYARSKIAELNNEEGIKAADIKLKQLEEKIKTVHERMEQLKLKESEYVAKIESAVALVEAQRILNGAKISDGSTVNVDSIIRDCEDELKKLDAEFKTLTFIGGLD